MVSPSSNTSWSPTDAAAIKSDVIGDAHEPKVAVTGPGTGCLHSGRGHDAGYLKFPLRFSVAPEGRPMVARGGASAASATPGRAGQHQILVAPEGRPMVARGGASAASATPGRAGQHRILVAPEGRPNEQWRLVGRPSGAKIG